jgi:hypothetical protein
MRSDTKVEKGTFYFHKTQTMLYWKEGKEEKQENEMQRKRHETPIALQKTYSTASMEKKKVGNQGEGRHYRDVCQEIELKNLKKMNI